MSTRSAPLSLRRDPVRLVFSRATWSSAWYLFGYLFAGSLLFAIALTAVTVGAALGFTLVGLPVLVAAAATTRWCASAERVRLRAVSACDVPVRYREPAGRGVMAQLRARWRDAATWRELAYLLGLYAPLFVLDTAVLTIWLTFLAGITLPAWYWAPWQTVHGTAYHGYQLGYFPNGPHGEHAWGLYVDTLPKALAVAAACLVLFLLFNYVLVATARLHAAAAGTLLRAPEDPLKEAKEVLSNPGPLREFIANGPMAPPHTPSSPPTGPSQPASRG